MKTKLTLYTLSGCKKCLHLKELLDVEQIAYDEVLCDNNNNSIKCDNLEIEVDCNFYPMAILTKKIEKDKGGYFVYAEERLVIHYCTRYDELLIKIKINNDYLAMRVHTNADMVELIKKNRQYEIQTTSAKKAE